jgi:excisionase family DNA binding protein
VIPAWLSPPAVAEQLGIDAAKVLGWIRAGELIAVNVATNASGRPRWRVSRSALDQFLASRQAQPVVPTTARRRRRKQDVVEFF